MVSTEEVHFSDFAVKNAINPHITYAEKFRKESEDIITDVGELASMLSAAGKQQELDTITKCVRELLDSSNDAKMYHEALNNLKTTYQATGEATDFHKFTKDFMQEYDDAAPYQVDQDPVYQAYMTNIDMDDEEAEEQIDDDIAIEGGSGISKNTKCPISGKDMLDLKEPVADSHGIVYEKQDILHYLKRQNGQTCKCPQAGTSHQITIKELVPALKVIVAQKKAKRKGGKGKNKGKDDDADVLDLS